MTSHLQEKGLWSEVSKEEIDKNALQSLFEDGKLSLEEYQGLVQQEDKMTIGWPMKIKDSENIHDV